MVPTDLLLHLFILIGSTELMYDTCVAGFGFCVGRILKVNKVDEDVFLLTGSLTSTKKCFTL